MNLTVQGFPDKTFNVPRQPGNNAIPLSKELIKIYQNFKSFFLLTPSTPGYRALKAKQSKCNMLLNWCYIQTKLSYCLHC